MIKKKKKKESIKREICLPLQGDLVLLNKQGVIIAVDANADNLRAAVWNNDTLVVTSTSFFRKGSRFMNVPDFSEHNLNTNDKTLENVNFKCVSHHVLPRFRNYERGKELFQRILRLRNIIE